jgi:hypothetical protein
MCNLFAELCLKGINNDVSWYKMFTKWYHNKYNKVNIFIKNPKYNRNTCHEQLVPLRIQMLPNLCNHSVLEGLV